MIDNSKNLFSKDAAKALGDGGVRPNAGATSIEVGTRISIAENAIIEVGKFINKEKEEKKYLYISGTEPMLSISTFLATPPTVRSYSNWKPVDDEEELPSLEIIATAVNDSYQPTSRNIEKWVNTEFENLRGKTIICTSRTDYKFGDNDFASKYLTFKVEGGKE